LILVNATKEQTWWNKNGKFKLLLVACNPVDGSILTETN